MKRISLIAFMLVAAVASSYALSLKELYEKYKTYPEASYSLIKGKEIKDLVANAKTPQEKEMLKKTKKIEILMVALDDEQREDLNADLKYLDKYEKMLTFTQNNSAPKDSATNLLAEMMDGLFNPTVTVEVYGRQPVKDTIKCPLFVFNFMDFTVLVNTDGEIKPDKAEDFVKVTFSTHVSVDGDEKDDNDEDEDDADAIDMKSMEALARSHCLIVFDDEIMPDLHNINEAQNYIVDNNLHFSGQNWLIGREIVKEKFPDSDESLAIIYTGIYKGSQD